MAAEEGVVAWLASLGDAELEALLLRRTDLHRSPPAAFGDLGARLSVPWAVEQVLPLLDRTAVQVGAYVCHVGGRATVSAVARDLTLPKAEAAAALRRLAEHGLAWPVLDDKAWRSVKGWEPVASRVLGWGSPIRRVVEHLPLATLRVALRELDLGPARSVAEARERLVACVEDPVRLGEVLATAPRQTTELLERLVTDPEAPVYGGTGWSWLQQRCLGVLSHSGAAVCAEVLRHQLGERAQGWVAREPRRSAPVGQVDAPVGRVEALVAAVRALLALVQQRPLKALRSGGVGVQEQRRLGKALGLDEPAVCWLLDLAGDAGLLTTGWEAPGELTERGTQWLRDDEEGAYAALAVAALDAPTRTRDEPPLKGDAFGRRTTPDLRAVAAACLTPAASTDEQVAWLHWRWYGGSAAARAEQLHTLDVLGLSSQGRPAPWLRSVLAGDAEVARAEVAAALPPAQDRAVFQADGTAFVGSRPSGGLRAFLSLVGSQESDRTWRLTPDRVRQALDDGWTSARLLEELEARSEKSVPQVLQQLVLDVAHKHGRITVVPSSTLLRVPDVPLALELVRDKRLAGLALVEVQPGVLASSKKPAEVLAALRKAGHAPVGPREAAPRKRTATSARRPAGPAPFDAGAAVRRLRTAPPGRSLPVAPMPTSSYDDTPLEALITHLPPAEQHLLLQAYDEGGAVEIEYVDRSGRRTVREIEAIDVEGRLLSAWCRLRDDERYFDPDSIAAVRPV